MKFDGSMGFQLVQKQNVLLKHLQNWRDLSYNSKRREMDNIRGKLELIQKKLNWLFFKWGD